MTHPIIEMDHDKQAALVQALCWGYALHWLLPSDWKGSVAALAAVLVIAVLRYNNS